MWPKVQAVGRGVAAARARRAWRAVVAACGRGRKRYVPSIREDIILHVPGLLVVSKGASRVCGPWQAIETTWYIVPVSEYGVPS